VEEAMSNRLISAEWAERALLRELLAYLNDPVMQRWCEESLRREKLEPGYQLDLFEDMPLKQETTTCI
jgi:hypothetical protein